MRVQCGRYKPVLRRRAGVLIVGSIVVGLGAGFGGAAAAVTQAPAGASDPAGMVQDASRSLQSDFAVAAREFHVPVNVLLAVAYHESRWEAHDGRPSTTGTYNVMGLAQLDATGRAARASSWEPACSPIECSPRSAPGRAGPRPTVNG